MTNLSPWARESNAGFFRFVVLLLFHNLRVYARFNTAVVRMVCLVLDYSVFIPHVLCYALCVTIDECADQYRFLYGSMSCHPKHCADRAYVCVRACVYVTVTQGIFNLGFI